MKRLLATSAIGLLLLAGCGQNTLTLNVRIDTDNAVRRSELTAASVRVIERRLQAREKKLLGHEMKDSDGVITLTVTVPDDESMQILREGLAAPFSMSIMKEVGKGQGDIISEKYGEFKETGITTEDFDWVSSGQAGGTEAAVTGSALLQFTPSGQEKLKKIFRENRGKVIGIFVRGNLMSKKLVDAKDTQGSIAIDGIPNTELAQAFADDVTVGLHVTFTEVR